MRLPCSKEMGIRTACIPMKVYTWSRLCPSTFLGCFWCRSFRCTQIVLITDRPESCSVESKDGPKVYKFNLVAVTGHAIASATVKYNHFGGSNAVMSRRVLKPARPSKPPARSTSRKPKREGYRKAGIKGKSIVKLGKIARERKWRWDNSNAEVQDLEKLRWAGHGWGGAKAQVRQIIHLK